MAKYRYCYFCFSLKIFWKQVESFYLHRFPIICFVIKAMSIYYNCVEMLNKCIKMFRACSTGYTEFICVDAFRDGYSYTEEIIIRSLTSDIIILIVSCTYCSVALSNLNFVVSIKIMSYEILKTTVLPYIFMVGSRLTLVSRSQTNLHARRLLMFCL